MVNKNLFYEQIQWYLETVPRKISYKVMENYILDPSIYLLVLSIFIPDYLKLFSTCNITLSYDIFLKTHLYVIPNKPIYIFHL